MARAPRVNGRQVEAALKKDGWFFVRQVGSHRHFAHDTKPGLVTVPQHAGMIFDPKTLGYILAQAGPTMDEFRGLL